MAMIHWWPLIDNTRDQITLTNLTNSGATTITSGKFGKAYSFNGTSGVCLSHAYSNNLDPNSFSFSFWVRLSSSWTGWGQVFTIGKKGTSWTDIRAGVDISSDKIPYFSMSDGTNYTAYNGPHHTALSTGIWYHIAGSVNNKVMSMYINGAPVATASPYTASFTPKFSDATIISIGGNSSEVGECDITDVRVYDHTLSQAEAKELSKAKIIHYTFNDTLAENTINLLPLSAQNITVNPSLNAGSPVSYTITSGLTQGATYTLSANVARMPTDTSTGPRLTILLDYTDGTRDQLGNATNTMGSSFPTDGNNYFYSVTLKANSAKTLKQIGGWVLDHSSGSGKNMIMWGAQLEAKDHPTPYTTSSRDANIVNEAMPIPATGVNINLTSDAGVGSYSLNSTGSTYISSTVTGDISQGVTASMWLKDVTTSGSYVAFADINSKLAFGFYNNQCILSCGGLQKPTANFSSLWKNGEWNHVVVRKDAAGNHTCFINGVETSYNSATNEWSHTAYNVVGARYNSGVYERQIVGKMSDFRMYMTALSNDDIKRLYKTRAYVTDNQSFCVGQFKQTINSRAMITDKYVANCNDLTEEINANYEVLDGIQFTKTQYIDTGVSFSNATTPIYIKAEVTPTATSGNNCLAGCGDSVWNGPVMFNFCGGKLEYGTSGYSTVSTAEGTFSTNVRMTTSAEIYGTAQKWYKNNAHISGITQRTRTATSQTLYIGTFKYSGGVAGDANGFHGYVHSFSLVYGNTKKYYIPVRRKSDNVLGFYEINSKTFLTNIGTGTFVAGQVINAGKALIFENGIMSGKTINEV